MQEQMQAGGFYPQGQPQAGGYMLEVRNLTRIYRSKNGQQVKALDGVNLGFPERGMVFILGKSGSGKSTLLNLMGGLDKFDAGEVIIKGRSSRDFSQSDFDSYRNTYLGFIFQEYNILNDFSVGANIALALELQGKKATNEEINRILAQVDMVGYAKRKPNELSGGQKQRIAIARALVKNPEIIMADEPTGALDSNTGKQVFDTLKALSREKLVIIVSHDRDFAEKYADRIIEMADGRVFSDVSKHVVPPVPISEGMEQMGQNVFRIRSGYKLTAKDLEMINGYLAQNPCDLILSGDARLNAGVAENAGVEAGGGIRTFAYTQPQDLPRRTYTKADSKFIRSRLPLRNAAKMGVSSLGHKTFRLVLTILFSLVAFTLFGVADTTSSYEKYEVTTRSMMDSNLQYVAMTLQLRETNEYYINGELDETRYYWRSDSFNDEDLARLMEETGLTFMPVYNGSSNSGQRITLSNHFVTADNLKSNLGTVYATDAYGFIEINQALADRLGYQINGRLPAAEGEVMIPKHLYNAWNVAGFRDADGNIVAAGELTLETGAKSVLDRKIKISMNGAELTFTIVGVIDTGFDYQRYSIFLPQEANAAPVEANPLTVMIQQKELESVLHYGLHALLYTYEGGIDTLPEIQNNSGMQKEIGVYFDYMNNRYLEFPVVSEENENSMHFSIDRVIAGGAGIEALAERVKFFDSGKTALGEKEILVPEYVLRDLANYGYLDQKGESHDIILKNLILADESAYYPDGYNVRNAWNVFLSGWDGDKLFQMAAGLEFEKVRDIYNNDENYNPNCPGNSFGNPELPLEDIAIIDFYRNDLNGRFFETPAVDGVRSGKQWRAYAEEQIRSAYNTAAGTSFTAEQFRTYMEQNWIYDNGDRNNIAIALYDYAIAQYDNYKDSAKLAEIVSEDSIREELSGEDKNAVLDEAYVQTLLKERRIAAVRQALDWGDLYEQNTWWTGGRTGREIRAEVEKAEFEAKLPQVIAFLADLELPFKYTLSYWINGNEVTQDKSADGFKIVGYFTENTGVDYDSSRWLVVSDELAALRQAERETVMEAMNSGGDVYENKWWVAEHDSGKYAFAIAAVPSQEKAAFEKIVNVHYDREGEIEFAMQNQVAIGMDTFNDFIETGAPIFLYIGLAFAAIAAFMLANFITTSISYKAREIGILRAVGARSSDVFLIFFSEAFFIAMINMVLSIAGTITAVTLINNILREQAGLMLTLLTFGVRQIILLFGLCVLTAFLASFLPVFKIARKRPVDAINNR